jgi:hemerythrin-like domain-containing protein
MSMNTAIHGAVRRDLARFLDALDRFRDGDRARAEQLATAWANFDNQLTRHYEGEHETAWPALQAVGVGQELITQMDEEHERLGQALASAGKAIAALRISASGSDAAAAREAIATLQTVAVEHLNHEEAEIEPIYLAKRDDPAIKAMGRQFAKVGPAVAAPSSPG